MNNRNAKRRRAQRARELLERTGKLTRRQTDMVVTGINAMPDPVAAKLIEEMEKDPESILSEIGIPKKRHEGR